MVAETGVGACDDAGFAGEREDARERGGREKELGVKEEEVGVGEGHDRFCWVWGVGSDSRRVLFA